MTLKNYKLELCQEEHERLQILGKQVSTVLEYAPNEFIVATKQNSLILYQMKLQIRIYNFDNRID